MNDSLQQTLSDLVIVLQRHQIPFALIGGLAVSIRGEPRFTADVDVVIGVDLPSAIRWLGVLQESTFRPLVSDAVELMRSVYLLPLRHTVTNVKVDVAIGVSGFERQIIARSTKVRVSDLLVPVATAEDLILMKLLAARPRDIEDTARIEMRQRAELDWEYLLKTGNELQEALSVDIVGKLRKLRQGDNAHNENQNEDD